MFNKHPKLFSFITIFAMAIIAGMQSLISPVDSVMASFNPISTPISVPVSLTRTPVSYAVDFGKSFTSIERICFDATFVGNLVDKNEGVLYAFVPVNARYGYGFVNTNNNPISKRTVCITPRHQGFNEFMDGKVNGTVKMSNGTATLQKLDIRLLNAR